MSWKQREKKSSKHVFSFSNVEACLSGFAKWDGCVELKVHYNGNDVDNEIGENVDSIHICDLQKFIKDLKEMEFVCKNYFSKTFEEWDY